jgi:hypothetical protein
MAAAAANTRTANCTNVDDYLQVSMAAEAIQGLPKSHASRLHGEQPARFCAACAWLACASPTLEHSVPHALSGRRLLTPPPSLQRSATPMC